jgi:hypothetical protein
MPATASAAAWSLAATARPRLGTGDAMRVRRVGDALTVPGGLGENGHLGAGIMDTDPALDYGDTHDLADQPPGHALCPVGASV